MLAVPARRLDLGEGSLAVVRVLQDLPGLTTRISVESREDHVPPGLCPPPVTSRTCIIKMMMIFYNIYKSYRLSAITDKAGAGVVISSLVQGGQVVHQARLGVLGDSVQSILWCIIVNAARDNVVIPHLYTTGIPAV